MRFKLLLISTLLFIVSTTVLSNIKREVRAAWLTTAYRLDWPQTQIRSKESLEQQQKELLLLLDRLSEANFNTILFQVRGRGNVTYPSIYEPYNPSLTGKINGNPGYDPLAFAIEECHKRGMECHAWLVTIPLGGVSEHKRLGSLSITKKQPQLCTQFQSNWYLNPGNPQTKHYLGNLVNEIITHYDVDGVHFDYLRYPENAPNFPDSKEFKAFAKGENLEQWRRNNITSILSHIYHSVKAEKPWVKVSTSPVGKHSDTHRYPSMGWNAFNSVYQDVFKWVDLGIQDQIYPMMYFRENQFYPFALDWLEQSNGIPIIPGLGIYFLDENIGNWTSEDLQRQIHFIRKHKLAGHAFFRAEFVVNNTKGVYKTLKREHYTYPAIPQAMKGVDSIPPSTPTQLTYSTTNYSVLLNWTESVDNDTKNQPKYIIYASPEYPVDTSKPENIIKINHNNTQFTYTPVYSWLKQQYFAVTAIDRYGNESEPIQLKPNNGNDSPE